MSWRSGSSNSFENSIYGGERRSDMLKLILYDLNSAIAPQNHRIMALQTAISEFDHDEEYKHDEELDLHADKILFQKLSFAFQVDRSSEEVAMICTALEMVYRASRSRVAVSFTELRESVLPIFVEMLGKPLHLRKQEELDLVLAEQDEKLNGDRDWKNSYSDEHSSRSESTYDQSYGKAKFKGKYMDDTSVSDTVSDSDTYYSYNDVKKPYKPQPDEQSYQSYQSYGDESSSYPSKPQKPQPDEQSYATYDDQGSYYDESVAKPKAFDDQSYQSSYQDDSLKKEKYVDEQSYQTNDESYDKSDDQSYQSYPQKPSKHVDDESHQESEERSFDKEKSHPDEQSYQGTYDKSLQESYDKESYDEASSKDRTYETESYDQTTQDNSYVGDTEENFSRSNDNSTYDESMVKKAGQSEDSSYQGTYDMESNCQDTRDESYVTNDDYNNGENGPSVQSGTYDYDADGTSTIQTNDQQTYQSGVSSYQGHDQSLNDETQTFDESLSRAQSQYGDEATTQTYGQSVSQAESTQYDDGAYDEQMQNDNIDRSNGNHDGDTYDGTYDEGTYDEGTYDNQTYDNDNQTFDNQTYDNDNQTFDNQTYDNDNQTFDNQTYDNDNQTFDNQTYDNDNQTFDNQTYDNDNQTFDNQTFDNQTYDNDNQTYDDQTYDDQTYGNDNQTYDEGTYDSGTYNDRSYDEGTYNDGTYSQADTFDENSEIHRIRGGASNYSEETHDEGKIQNGRDEICRIRGGSSQDSISRGGSTYDEGTYDEGTYDEGTYDEGTYDQGTYDEGTYDEGTYDDVSHQKESYDERTYDEGTYDEGTYDEGASEIYTISEETSQNESHGMHTASGGTSQNESSEIYTISEEGTYNDTISRQEGSYDEGYSQAGKSYAEGTYTDGTYTTSGDEGMTFDGATTIKTYEDEGESTIKTYDGQTTIKTEDYTFEKGNPTSYADGQETAYTEEESYGREGDNQHTAEPDHFQDDVSEVTESVFDHSIQKPQKESYDVETVYSDEGEDDQSHAMTVESSESSGQSSQYSGAPKKNFELPSFRSGGLSTVEEESREDSSHSRSLQSSAIPSKRSSEESIAGTHQTLPTVEEYPTKKLDSWNDQSTRGSDDRSTGGYSRASAASRSVGGYSYGGHSTVSDSRSVMSSSTGTRSIMNKKFAREPEINQRVARLEKELEIIRVEDPTNPVGVSRALQVLRYFSRILSAMVPMAHHPGLLDALVYQLERQRYGKHADHFNEYDDGEPRTEEEKHELSSSRVDAIATIVNLACAEENKSKMACHNGLLDAIINVAQSDPSEEAREHAAIVLMNLSYEDENKELMVQHPSMLETLVKLVRDPSPFTRRYSSAAMFTLACVVSNTERMTSYCEGEILECLRRVLSDDPVDEARINAAEALFNMARNNTEETIQTMGEHDQLLATLAKAVLTDYSADVRVFCARALEWMAAGIHHPMDCHPMLLSALVVSAQWTKTSCIVEAMKTQASLSENRLPMASHDGMLQALSNLALLEALVDSDVRKTALASLEMISREPSTRQYMVRNEQVMRAMAKAPFEHGDQEIYGEDNEGNPVNNKRLKEAMKNISAGM